jgi:hypothetical protein
MLDQTRQQRHLHGPWWKARLAVYEAFVSAGDSALSKRAVSLKECCRGPRVVVSDTGDLGVWMARCKDRCCPRCQVHRSRVAAGRFEAAVRLMDAPRHVVLTAPRVSAPLADQLRSLRGALRRLRRSVWWRDRCVGGVYAIEITRGRDGRGWHPHIHLVVDGEWMHQGDLQRAWESAVLEHGAWSDAEPGARAIAWIGAVHSRGKTARYIAKYIAKPADVASWSPWAIREYAAACRGMRFLDTFGRYHGTVLDPRDRNEPAPRPSESASCSMLDDLAHAGCDHAVEVIACVVVRSAHLAGLFTFKPPPERLEAAARDPCVAARASAALGWIARARWSELV